MRRSIILFVLLSVRVCFAQYAGDGYFVNPANLGDVLSSGGDAGGYSFYNVLDGSFDGSVSVVSNLTVGSLQIGVDTNIITTATDITAKLNRVPFSFVVQDPTNNVVPYWQNVSGAGSLTELYVQSVTSTGLVDIVMRSRDQAMGTYTNMAVNQPVNPTGYLITSFTNNTIGTNQLIGIRFKSLSGFATTNRIDAYGIYTKN